MRIAAKDPKNDYMARKLRNKSRFLLMPMLVKELSNSFFDDLDMLLHNNKSSDDQNPNAIFNQSIQKLSEMNFEPSISRS